MGRGLLGSWLGLLAGVHNLDIRHGGNASLVESFGQVSEEPKNKKRKGVVAVRPQLRIVNVDL